MVLGLFGIACGVYSTLSCEWFAWTPLDEDEAWGVFAIDATANQAESVGLFRYQHFHQDKNAMENTTRAFFFLGSVSSCQLYSDQGDDWLLISRSTDHWMFTAQLCWVVATALAALSTVAILCRCFACLRRCCLCCCSSCRCASSVDEPPGKKVSCCTSCGFLLASGLQAASCLASTALCGGYDFWECPWLQGAHASAGAAWFYLLCWLLCVCAYRLVLDPRSSALVTVNHYHHYHHRHQNHHRHRHPEEEKKQEEDEDLEAAALERQKQQRREKMSAEELLGTDDPVIHRAVGQKAVAIREFAVAQPMMEDDDEDEVDDEEVLAPPPPSVRTTTTTTVEGEEESHMSRGGRSWRTDDSSQATPKAKSYGRASYTNTPTTTTTTLEP